MKSVYVVLQYDSAAIGGPVRLARVASAKLVRAVARRAVADAERRATIYDSVDDLLAKLNRAEARRLRDIFATVIRK